MLSGISDIFVVVSDPGCPNTERTSPIVHHASWSAERNHTEKQKPERVSLYTTNVLTTATRGISNQDAAEGGMLLNILRSASCTRTRVSP